VLKGDSLHNTIPTFPVYMVRNVLRWVKSEGGVAGMEKRNRKKGDLLYGAIDEQPDFFRAPVEKGSRSYMNVVFRLPTEELEKKFIAEAAKKDLVNIKGHRSVGGIRVSTYNAMPIDGIEAFVTFMRTFSKANR
jgi:phosphoserine aminotransferase